MNLYLLGIIFFSIVLIGSISILIYLIKDEKNLKEVSKKDLIKYGKTYTKKEIEDQLFEVYQNILFDIGNDGYSLLKDMVSDQIYNELLLDLKNRREKQERRVISNIQKEFSKLISFQFIQDLEVIKLWVRYSSIEYTKIEKKELDENQQEIAKEIITEGNPNTPISHEYIVTFVKNKAQTEEIICPNCGYQTKILTSSHCARCDQEIVPKKMHWVYAGRIAVAIQNSK